MMFFSHARSIFSQAILTSFKLVVIFLTDSLTSILDFRLKIKTFVKFQIFHSSREKPTSFITKI